MSAYSSTAALDELASLVDRAGARLRFDRHADITKPCWFCSEKAAPAHRLRRLRHRETGARVWRPVCATCLGIGLTKRQDRRFRLTVSPMGTSLVVQLEVRAANRAFPCFWAARRIVDAELRELARSNVVASAVRRLVWLWRQARCRSPWRDGSFRERESAAPASHAGNASSGGAHG